jgi:hypothetical protein
MERSHLENEELEGRMILKLFLKHILEKGPVLK